MKSANNIKGTTIVMNLNIVVATMAYMPVERDGENDRRHLIPVFFTRAVGDFAVISDVNKNGDFTGSWLVSLEKTLGDKPNFLVFPREASRLLNAREIRHLNNGGGEAIRNFLAKNRGRETAPNERFFRLLAEIDALPISEANR